MIALVVDIILALVIAETLALVALYRITGRGIRPTRVLGTLAAGFFVMLALRLALAGEMAGPIAACLLASLVAHVADLASRWRA